MKSGDKCPRDCGGQLITRNSRAIDTTRVRYLVCNKCGCNGGKSLVSEEMIFKRNNSNRTSEK